MMMRLFCFWSLRVSFPIAGVFDEYLRPLLMPKRRKNNKPRGLLLLVPPQ